jgi:hypothetical protein
LLSVFLKYPLLEDGHIPPRDIKLLPFWQTRRLAWFVFVESRFRLRNIVDEMAKLDHVLSTLPEDMVGQILDNVEVANPFWRACLLETHSLTAYTPTAIPFIYSFSGNSAASVPISTIHIHVSLSDL